RPKRKPPFMRELPSWLTNKLGLVSKLLISVELVVRFFIWLPKALTEKFILFWRRLKLTPPFTAPRLSTPAITFPLYPLFLFFLRMIFNIPAFPPEASYFAEGLVITSTLSIASAGI